MPTLRKIGALGWAPSARRAPSGADVKPGVNPSDPAPTGAFVVFHSSRTDEREPNMVTDTTGRRVRAALGAVLVAAGTAAVMAFAPGTAAALPEPPEPSSSAGSITFSLPSLLTPLLGQLGFGSLDKGSVGSSSTGSLGSSNTGSFGSSYGSVVDSPSA
ncbi:hypothetical protein A5N72_04755 [Prescottella equi]|nr:hypothetical protein A5N72_04755 [Prescottella equi]